MWVRYSMGLLVDSTAPAAAETANAHDVRGDNDDEDDDVNLVILHIISIFVNQLNPQRYSTNAEQKI